MNAKQCVALSETTRSTIEAFNHAFNNHDVDAVMALMTNDCVFENTSPRPDGTRYVGSEQVRAFWEDLFRVSPHARFVTEDMFVAHDRATVTWTYNWIDSAGKAGHVRGVDVFRVRDGKVSEKLSYVKG